MAGQQADEAQPGRVVNIAVSVHLIAYLQDRGYDLGFAATATGLIGAMQVLGRVVLRVLGDRVPLRVTAAVVLAIQPISLVALLTFPVGMGVWAFIPLFGAARGVAGLVRPSTIASVFGRERFASISGAMATFVTGATAIAPVGAGVGLRPVRKLRTPPGASCCCPPSRHA